METYQSDKRSLMSQSTSINSNFVSILIETQTETKFCISKKTKSETLIHISKFEK